jgi:hypothetical protein
MVLAALSDPDRDGMQQTYEAMVREQELRPDADAKGMTNLGRVVKSRVIQGDTTGRVLAGSVVLELVHIAVAWDKPPTVGKAPQIVAHNQHLMAKKSSPDILVREVEKAFSKYRSGAHLWAAVLSLPNILDNLGIGGSLSAFLGMARAYEAFMDDHVVSSRFSWNPFRIPERFPATPIPKFPPFTEQELG